MVKLSFELGLVASEVASFYIIFFLVMERATKWLSKIIKKKAKITIETLDNSRNQKFLLMLRITYTRNI